MTNEKEKIPLVVIYEEDGEFKLFYPENDSIPVFKMIGFLECYLSGLKKSIVSTFDLEKEKEKETGGF